jgi:NifU-like protein involved in Fe-S cluster formation
VGDDAYNERVAERFGRAATALGAGIEGTAGALEQGAVVSFAAAVVNGRLHNVGFRACACPHIIAACSLVAERLEGAQPEQLVDPALLDGLKELEIPVEKTGKILILQDALGACYADFEDQRAAGASGETI